MARDLVRQAVTPASTTAPQPPSADRQPPTRTSSTSSTTTNVDATTNGVPDDLLDHGFLRPIAENASVQSDPVFRNLPPLSMRSVASDGGTPHGDPLDLPKRSRSPARSVPRMALLRLLDLQTRRPLEPGRVLEPDPRPISPRSTTSYLTTGSRR